MKIERFFFSIFTLLSFRCNQRKKITYHKHWLRIVGISIVLVKIALIPLWWTKSKKESKRVGEKRSLVCLCEKKKWIKWKWKGRKFTKGQNSRRIALLGRKWSEYYWLWTRLNGIWVYSSVVIEFLLSKHQTKEEKVSIRMVSLLVPQNTMKMCQLDH